MSIVGAATYTGTLAAHALPSPISSIQRGLSKLPKALPKFYEEWQSGIPRAKIIVDRYEKLGETGPVEVHKYGGPFRGDSDIFADKELHTVMSREEFLKYATWRNDLKSVGRMVLPTFLLGPVGLLYVPLALRCEQDLPSQFLDSEEAIVRSRLVSDMQRLSQAQLLKGHLWNNLVEGLEGYKTQAPSYTDKEYDSLEEMFDMDSFSVRSMDAWHHWIPILGPKHGKMKQVCASHNFLKVWCNFYNLPGNWLGRHGRQKNIIEHFRVLRTDDAYIRRGGIAALSDAELFEACFARAIARQEESEITRCELETRLDVWLKLGDDEYWAKRGFKGTPSPMWQTLLAANIYSDPAYDPHLDKVVEAKIAETPGIEGKDIRRDIKGSFDKYFNHMSGVVKQEAVAAFEHAEIQRAERELATQKKLDQFVTTLQQLSTKADTTQHAEEQIVSESTEVAAEELPAYASGWMKKAFDMPVMRKDLSAADKKAVRVYLETEAKTDVVTVSDSQMDKIVRRFPQFVETAGKQDKSLGAEADKFASGAK